MNKQEKVKRIQELKSEYSHLGSQEALRYIRRISQLYDVPEKIASSINAQIREDSTLLFPAESSHIYGLIGVFEEINNHAAEFSEKNGIDYPAVIMYEALPLNLEFNLGSETYRAQPRVTRDFLVHPYREVQFEEDPHIPKLIQRTLEAYINRWSIPEKVANRMRKYVDGSIKLRDLWEYIEKNNIDDDEAERMCEEVDKDHFSFDLNWKQYFSPQYQAQEENRIRSLIESQEIPLITRFKRIKQARVIKDRGLKREILGEWLGKHGSGYSSVGDLLKAVRCQKDNRARSVSQTSTQSLRMNGAPIQELSLYAFLEEAIKSEKRFVERFIRS